MNEFWMGMWRVILGRRAINLLGVWKQGAALERIIQIGVVIGDFGDHVNLSNKLDLLHEFACRCLGHLFHFITHYFITWASKEGIHNFSHANSEMDQDTLVLDTDLWSGRHNPNNKIVGNLLPHNHMSESSGKCWKFSCYTLCVFPIYHNWDSCPMNCRMTEVVAVHNDFHISNFLLIISK